MLSIVREKGIHMYAPISFQPGGGGDGGDDHLPILCYQGRNLWKALLYNVIYKTNTCIGKAQGFHLQILFVRRGIWPMMMEIRVLVRTGTTLWRA